MENQLSLHQKAGQRLMAGFDGTCFNEDLKFLIGTLCVGGIILFSRNIENPSQIKKLCFAIQEFAKEKKQLPLFIAIDQEGGEVARLKKPFSIFPGNPYIKTIDQAKDFAVTTAKELTEIGVNMNMSPVLDVPPNNFKSIMDGRVFGNDPAVTAILGSTVIDCFQKNNIIAVAKHFPGIGRTILDSHISMPYIDTDFKTLEASDFIPFKKAIKNKVCGIMLSHILYTRLDQNFPASLSFKIAKKILRDEMGYDGLVITDDLDMGSVKKNYTLKKSISNIFDAEIDIVLICHKGPNIKTAFDELKKLSEQSEKEKIDIPIKRILNLKLKMGITS